MLHSSLVLPLLATPRDLVSQRNSLSFDVLKKSKNNSPITCQKCHNCQVNKCRQLKYGKLPTKLVITNPWEALCVDLIGPYTLKGKEKTQIDFMCITILTQQWAGSKLLSCQYHSMSLIFPRVQRGIRAQTNMSNHISESVTVARWIIADNSNMANCHQNLRSPTLGRHYVWIS